jgi:hypothetical protein
VIQLMRMNRDEVGAAFICHVVHTIGPSHHRATPIVTAEDTKCQSPTTRSVMSLPLVAAAAESWCR